MRRSIAIIGLLHAALTQAAPPNPFVAPSMDMTRGVGGAAPVGIPQGIGTAPPAPPAGPPPGMPDSRNGASGNGLESELQGRLRQSLGSLEVLAIVESQAMIAVPVTGSSASSAPGAVGFNPVPPVGSAGAPAGSGSSGAQKRRTWMVRHLTPTTMIGQRVLPVIEGGVLTLYQIDSGPGPKDPQAVMDSGVVIFSGGVDASGISAKAPTFVAEDPKVAQRIRTVLDGGSAAGSSSANSSGSTPGYSGSPIGGLR